MAQGNATLQKKLTGLKSEFGRLLECPSSYIHDDIDGKVGFYQTAQKISFIKNLLTAKMDSHFGGRPEHLNDLAIRLSILEKTFINWVESGDGVSKSSDTSTSCSCTESCIVDEEFVEEDSVNQEAKEFGVLSLVSQVKERGRVESKEEEIKDEEENERNEGDVNEYGTQRCKIEFETDVQEVCSQISHMGGAQHQ